MLKICRVSFVLCILIVVEVTMGGARQNLVLAQSKLKIVASFSILADVAKQVAGDLATVDSIVPPDGDAHEYEPVAEDVKKIADADIIFVNGLLFEGFLDKLISDSGKSATVVLASKGVLIRAFTAPSPNLIETPSYTPAVENTPNSTPNESSIPVGFLGYSGEYACNNPAQGQEIGNCDPHVWQDPANVIIYVQNIRDALIAKDSTLTEQLTANADSYIAQLKQLDMDINTRIQSIPIEKRVLVTNHDALGYFAAKYGLKVAGFVIPSLSTVAEPSAQDIAKLIDGLKATGVKAVFTENIGNDKLAQQLAQESGVQIVQSLYTDALGQPGTEGDSYIGMMRSNLNAIVKSLDGN